jgi:UDP-N-acetylmuramate: L-alanyl-gamma-D-glutamyl-meso-diaminopimelate ligase
VSHASGDGPDFVVEADEYDTAFFDKRSKFVHYRPTVAILNNLEYDHADIFPDLARSSASSTTWCASCRDNGRLIVNGEDARWRSAGDGLLDAGRALSASTAPTQLGARG